MFLLLTSFTLVSAEALKSKRSQIGFVGKLWRRLFNRKSTKIGKKKIGTVDSTQLSDIASVSGNNRCCCLKNFNDYYKVKRPYNVKECSELCSSGLWFIKHKIKKKNPKLLQFGLAVPGTHIINMENVTYERCNSHKSQMSQLYKVCKGRNCWKKDRKNIKKNYCCCNSCYYSQRAIKRRRGKNKGPCKADHLKKGEVTGVESCKTICKSFHCSNGVPLGMCEKGHSCVGKNNGKKYQWASLNAK